MSSFDLMATLRERYVRITKLLEAPPARVHRAWSDPEEIATWFPRVVEGSLSEGAHSVLTWHDRRIPIHVLESDPPVTFRFRWTWPPPDDYATQVTVKLAPHGYGTRLTLVDGPFDLTIPGVLEAYEEALQGWGETIACLRAQIDFSVDLRRERF